MTLNPSVTPQPIDFDGEVNLFHFVLLRCVGKGAFGKVSPEPTSRKISLVFTPIIPLRFAWYSTNKPVTSTHSNTSIKQNA